MRNLFALPLRRLCVTAGLLLATSAMLFAQSDAGSIVGYVRDQTGASVPGAKVVVQDEGTKEDHVAPVDNQGHYSVPNLHPGLYSVSVQAPGFKAFQSVHNKLDASSTIDVDANLDLGSSKETVEVTASASLLQTESGAVQSDLGEHQIQSQELNGRNPIYMAQLLPGVRNGSTLGDFNFSMSNGNYEINGARSQDTAITMDGAPAVRTRGNGTGIGVPNVDSTEEIQVLTADYQAEYGGAGGGQIRIVSKSGTTDFHGSAYEYLRNSAMNANTWSRNQSKLTDFASPFRYNDFGFAVGGPMWVKGLPKAMRQKLFFFVADDWIRYRFTDTQYQTVPTTLMRQGNFSELLGPNIFFSSPKVLTNPNSCTTTNGTRTCTPFPNNIIPANLLSPNGLAIMNAYPGPTSGLVINGNQNWVAQAGHPINQRKGTTNGDFVVNDQNHIAVRRDDLSYFEYQPFDQGSGLTGKYFKRPNQTNTITWTDTLSPTMINEASATLSLDDVYIPVNTSLPGFDRSLFGINYPYILPEGKDIPGKIPSVNLPSPFYSLSGGPYPSHSSGPIWTFSDSLTKVQGNHTFKVGFYYLYSGENDRDQINVATVPGGSSNQNGTFVFTDSYTAGTGVALANLALGAANSYTEIGPRAYTIWRSPMVEWFAQDSWKITPKLHIDYGVRQTINYPFHAQWGNADYFNPASYNRAQAVTVNPTNGTVEVGSGNQYNGVIIPGRSGFPSDAAGHGVAAAQTSAYNSLFDPGIQQGYVNTTAQFQPRLGIAYQADSKTVVRAGVGRFLTRMGLLDNIFPGGNSPFQPFVTVTNVSVDNPGAALNSSSAAPITLTTLARNLKPPEAWNYNFTVERQLPLASVLSVAYVGHRGLHAWDVYDINQAPVGSLFNHPGTNVAALTPYPGFAAIQQEQSNVNSTYNALQVTWSRRFVNGFSFSASYTLSKSMDDSSNYRDIVPDTYNASNLWGPSEYDSRHVAVITWSYELPIYKDHSKLSGKLLGGWLLSGLTQFQTGTPCGVGTNNDYAGVGEYGSFGCGTEGQFWTMNGTPQVLGQFSNSSKSPTQYFSTTNSSGQPLFTPPAPGTFNLQKGVRDSIYGPGFQDWNLSAFKSFAVTETQAVEFRAEAYDFSNHPNWNTPGYTPNTSTFGKVTSKTGLTRQLQLSLRYSF
jgi:hypothetical protein